ncbi:MAG: peroxidase [Acidobacteriota bacterium]|nr:peroxidase [Acidobacteriota bacterium]
MGERDRALCEIAEKVSHDAARVSESDWDELRRLGLDDEAVLEVTHVVGLFNYLTRLADGLGVLLDEGTRTASETGVALQRR